MRSSQGAFADIYQDKIIWIFYAAWDFHPVSGDSSVPKSGQSYNMVYKYPDSGRSGFTKYAEWSVYWVGHPSKIVLPYMHVRQNDIVDIAKGMTWDLPWDRSAKFIQNKIDNTNHRIFLNRDPVTIMIFTYSPTYATASRVPKYHAQLDRLILQRISGFSWAFDGFFGLKWY